MRIVIKKTADSKAKPITTIIMSRHEWQKIGKIAGWNDDLDINGNEDEEEMTEEEELVADYSFLDNQETSGKTAADEIMEKLISLQEAIDDHTALSDPELIEEITEITNLPREAVTRAPIPDTIIKTVRDFLVRRLKEVKEIGSGLSLGFPN